MKVSDEIIYGKPLSFYKIVILLAALLFVCVGGDAQQNSVIGGTITDQGGAVVPGAHIVLKEAATGFMTTTESNEAGLFSFPGLNIGSYDLSVTAKGFDTTIKKGLVL